jgi:hypothetical protein
MRQSSVETKTSNPAENQRDSLPVRAGSDRQGQQRLWDRWWYDRFEIPNDLPPEIRRCAVTVEGQTWTLALLDHIAPRTCQAFWELLPFEGPIIHCAWFGHAAFFLDRIEMPSLGYDLENRSARLAPGDWIWDPYIKEITFAYGRYAEVHFPTTIWLDDRPHPNQACIFARIDDGLDSFAALCKSLRFEGTKFMHVARLDGPEFRESR